MSTDEQKAAPCDAPTETATSTNIDITQIDQDLRELRIYLDGVFDMTHYGHFRLFKQVKDHFPNSTIIVGVSGDEETCRLKGQTLMSEDERAESVGHCKWVDEVVVPCPWVVTQEFLDAQRIDYVAHDGEAYVSANSSDIYDFVKRQGKFIATQRTEGVSTTGLINRIVKRYNEFVLRNLKRGVGRSELNLSWTREQRIKMEQRMVDGKAKAKEFVDKADEFVGNVKDWLQDPHLFVSDFLGVFGPQGRLTTRVKAKVSQMKDEFVELAVSAPM